MKSLCAYDGLGVFSFLSSEKSIFTFPGQNQNSLAQTKVAQTICIDCIKDQDFARFEWPVFLRDQQRHEWLKCLSF